MQVDKTVCPVYRWLEYGWTNQLVLSIYKLFKDLLWTSYNRAIVDGKSHPVDQLVCVCVTVTTLRNRESDLGAQSSSYQKA